LETFGGNEGGTGSEGIRHKKRAGLFGRDKRFSVAVQDDLGRTGKQKTLKSSGIIPKEVTKMTRKKTGKKAKSYEEGPTEAKSGKKRISNRWRGFSVWPLRVRKEELTSAKKLDRSEIAEEGRT